MLVVQHLDHAGARRAAVPQKPLAPAVLEGGTFGLRCGDLNITAQVGQTAMQAYLPVKRANLHLMGS